MAEAFRDPRVGCVTGRLEWRDEAATATSTQEGLYWRYERRVRELESRAGLLTAVTGALLAVRATAYRPVPPIGLDGPPAAALRPRGRRAGRLRARGAVATDRPISGLREQLRNRTRTATRGIRANLSMVGPLAPWRRPGPAVAIWSHKLLRWATPWFVLIVAAVAGWSSGSAASRGYLVGAARGRRRWLAGRGGAHLLIGAGRHPSRAVAFARSFAVVNVAFATGWLNVIRGREIEVWHRAEWRTET